MYEIPEKLVAVVGVVLKETVAVERCEPDGEAGTSGFISFGAVVVREREGHGALIERCVVPAAAEDWENDVDCTDWVSEMVDFVAWTYGGVVKCKSVMRREMHWGTKS